MEFQVGDRVKVTGGMRKHRTGTVVGCDGGVFAIRFDEYIHGHDCDGLCKKGYGWFVIRDNLELIESSDNAIVVPDDDSIANLLFI